MQLVAPAAVQVSQSGWHNEQIPEVPNWPAGQVVSSQYLVMGLSTYPPEQAEQSCKLVQARQLGTHFATKHITSRKATAYPTGVAESVLCTTNLTMLSV